MLKRLKKEFNILLAAMIIGYIGFCAAVYFFPQYFFYAPSAEKADLSKAVAAGFPAEEVSYKSSDGTQLYGWYVKPTSQSKLIVFMHGNSFNIASFYHKLIPLIKAGYGAFIGEYRGFGGVKGSISEKGLAMDAAAAIDYLHSQGWQNKNIILYGMSLGSYTSSRTALDKGREDPFAGLILEVPFDSVLNVVKQRIWNIFPFELIIRDTYDNITSVKSLNLPLLIHGAAADSVVPIERAKALFAEANEPKQLKIYPNAEHSELFKHENWRDILRWLEENEKTD